MQFDAEETIKVEHHMSWRETLLNSGTAVIRNETRENLLALSAQLGEAVPDRNSNDIVKALTPSPSSTGNSLTAKYGMSAFPFHTEAAYWEVPPRYLMLFCLDPGKARRPTGYFDAFSIGESDLLELRSAQYRIRRNQGSFLVRSVERSRNGFRIRADRECMLPVKTDRDPLVTKLLSKVASGASWHFWEKGDLLVINNYRMLHGRGAADKPDTDRKILRILIS
jgi:L-asparagine oxygenase